MQKQSYKGLSSDDAKKLIERYGYNNIELHAPSALRRFLKKITGPIPLMIGLAAGLSGFLRRWEDFWIIITLLIVNIGVEVFQEYKASNALEILTKKLAREALVLRDDNFQKIDAKLIVPGDIIKVRLGDIVPADITIVSTKKLQVDQSTLTGESLPVFKSEEETIYANSIIKMGEAIAQVNATGKNTFFGKSSLLVEKALQETQSHFQKAILKIGSFLILFAIILAILVFVVSIFRGFPLLETLNFLLVLTIASVPVALPAVLSVTMAISAYNIAKKNAIVRNIGAIEELAGVDVVCIDKTGTLTKNELTVGPLKTYGKYTNNDLMLYATLASDDNNEDPIEKPLFDFLLKNNLTSIKKKYSVEDFTPFNPNIKKSISTVRKGTTKFTVTKGAPQVIIDLIDDTKLQKQAKEDVVSFARSGYRTLAVAIKQDKDTELIGLISLFDPPRKDSGLTIRKLKEEGVKTTMITGDNVSIAKEMANRLKMESNILPASTLHDNEQSVDILSTDGFAEVVPADKYHIVETYQNKNHIVAMTGDGVNDAPALQKANIGIAVAGATDAARASSDLILLSPGLNVINDAIKLARQAFRRMMSYALFRIAETIRIIFFITLAFIIFNTYPVTAIMIVLLALLNDIPVMLIGYDNARVDTYPIRWNMKEVLIVATVLGVLGVISSFTLFSYLMLHDYSMPLIQALIFLKFDIAGHSTLYLTRTGHHHFWHKPYPSLLFFIPTFATRIIGTLIAIYGIFMTPVGWKYAIIVWIYALIWWVFNDYIKVFTFKLLRK